MFGKAWYSLAACVAQVAVGESCASAGTTVRKSRMRSGATIPKTLSLQGIEQGFDLREIELRLTIVGQQAVCFLLNIGDLRVAEACEVVQSGKALEQLRE